MNLNVSGPGISDALADVIASLTNRARLRYGDVIFDEAEGVVRLPIVRYPLIKKRSVLPDRHDRSKPVNAIVTVRDVLSCDIENNTTPELGDYVHLLFGIQLQDERVYACSAEEDRGQTCYSITMRVSELDIEIADASGSDAGA